jgi:uncharacterized protein
MGLSAERVRMLFVGTATAGYQPGGGVERDDGAVGWLSDGRLLLTLVSVQQQHVQAMMEDRLDIDVATREASQTLTGLARQAMATIDAKALDAFLGNPK